jgi:hypothetical protein
MAQAEACVHQMFSFVEATEVVATGYDKVRYHHPAIVGTRVHYIYTLESVVLQSEQERARTKWRTEAVNKEGETIMTSIWLVDYNRQEPIMIGVTRWLQRLMGWESRMPLPVVANTIAGVGRTMVAVALLAILVASPFLYPVDAIIAL